MKPPIWVRAMELMLRPVVEVAALHPYKTSVIFWLVVLVGAVWSWQR